MNLVNNAIDALIDHKMVNSLALMIDAAKVSKRKCRDHYS